MQPSVQFTFGHKRGVREAVEKDGALGILTGELSAAAGGTSAALIFGYLSALVFHGKAKRA